MIAPGLAQEATAPSARVADAFGLLYAAGREAQRHGVLPDSWRCGPAVISVYRDFYTGPKPPKPIDDQLRAYLRQPGVRDLDSRGLRRMGPSMFTAARAFLQTNRTGEREAILPRAAAARELPDLVDRLPDSPGRSPAESGERSNHQ